VAFGLTAIGACVITLLQRSRKRPADSLSRLQLSTAGSAQDLRGRWRTPSLPGPAARASPFSQAAVIASLSRPGDPHRG
jgi:hypothetical protein